MTDHKIINLKDGSTLEYWEGDQPAQPQRRFIWIITTPEVEYDNYIDADYGAKYIDDSESDEEARQHIKNLNSKLYGYGRDAKSGQTNYKIHRAPDDAAEILKAEIDGFLFRQYLERKQARNGIKKLGQYVRETALANITKKGE